MAIANTQSAEQDHFDLLPFIAIMMCLLGALLLVTMSMAAINIGAGAGAGEGWVPKYGKAGRRASAKRDGSADRLSGITPPDALRSRRSAAWRIREFSPLCVQV